jgi:hypothetical protein
VPETPTPPLPLWRSRDRAGEDGGLVEDVAAASSSAVAAAALAVSLSRGAAPSASESSSKSLSLSSSAVGKRTPFTSPLASSRHTLSATFTNKVINQHLRKTTKEIKIQ